MVKIKYENFDDNIVEYELRKEVVIYLTVYLIFFINI